MEGTGEEMEEPTPRQKVEALLLKLLRTVVHCFYETKDEILVDFVVAKKRVTQKMVMQTLQFDVKLTRKSLTKLVNDRLLCCTTEKVVAEDGSSRREDYYFIKLGRLANVVKFKLDQIQIRVAGLEKTANEVKSFKCVSCNKAWSDLELGEIFSTKTLNFWCPLCRRGVTEDVSAVPKDMQALTGKFQVQTTPIYDILREIDNLQA